MTRVDFYVLADTAPGDRYTVACRLVEKAYAQGRRVYLHLDGEADVNRIDALLWTFREQSFIPHGALGKIDPKMTPVLLGCDQDPSSEDDVLVNLAAQVPAWFGRFRRVAEIIDGDAVVKRFGRERYRFYKDRGYPLETHELKK